MQSPHFPYLPMTVTNKYLMELVRYALANAHDDEWSVQGMGMFRLYLGRDKVIRLHIWDNRYKVPGVSTIHNHPWDFTSFIVAGSLRNLVYWEETDSLKSVIESVKLETEAARPMKRHQIHCGEDEHSVSEPEDTKLLLASSVTYQPGDAYIMRHDEIHETVSSCTITLVHRRFVKPDRDTATVFYPPNEKWVTAKPRPASPNEVKEMMRLAIELLNTSRLNA